jgi:RNA polymerase sigma factor (sigma-70 family)
MLYFQWMKRHDQRLYQQWSRTQASVFCEDGPSEAVYQGPQRILIPLEEAWEVADEPDRAPDQRLLADSDRQMLQNAIDALEEREADIIRRYYYQGQTFRQIAAETGRSASRVSELHKKGLQTMRCRLRQQEQD